MGDIKQATFRLGEEAVEKFKAFATEFNCNQAEMFDSLMNNFELAQAKNQISNRGKEIETFQVTVNTLTGMFVNSLAINQSSEDRIREELSLELHTKDTTIKDLQDEKIKLKDELKTIKDELDTNSKVTKEMESNLNKLNKDIETITVKLNKDIEQKTNTINSLQSQLQTLNGIIDEYKTYKDTYTTLELNIKELKQVNADLTNSNTDIQFKLYSEIKMKDFFENQIKSLKESLEAEHQEKKLLDLEHKKEIETLKNEFNNRLEKEIEKSKNEFNEKLNFEKEKMQLSQDKINNDLDFCKSKYNEAQEKYVQQQFLIEKLENKIEKQMKENLNSEA